ncbi:MAG: hypothetical protein AAGF46_08370, partial [Pseudomonadota bacterium]
MASLRLLQALVMLMCIPAALRAEPVTIEQIMADPDWIGSQPEQPFFSDDGGTVHFQAKRAGEDIRDHFAVNVVSALVTPVAASATPTTSNASRRFNAAGDAVVWTANGDVFVRDWPNGSVRQLTQLVGAATDAQFVVGRNAVSYTVAGQYYLHDLDSGRVRQLLDLQFKDDPGKAESFDTLRANQERLYNTIVEDQRRTDALRQHREEAQRARDGGAPLPLYLGKSQSFVA